MAPSRAGFGCGSPSCYGPSPRAVNRPSREPENSRFCTARRKISHGRWSSLKRDCALSKVLPYLGPESTSYAHGSVFDVLSITDQGTGAGQIGLSGTTVLYGGVAIGALGGGINGAPLGVYFYGGAATPAAVQALLRAITFHNTSENPYTRTRTIRFTLTDGDGGTSNLAEQDLAVHAL